MTIRVRMYPLPEEARLDTTNAINQIVLRLQKHLPKFGVVINDGLADRYELVAAHAGQTSGRATCDVAHCHGLYPTSKPALTDGWHWAANRSVVENLRCAKRITVPSDWVAQILRRDMHIQPDAIPWAIDADEWTPGENRGYGLWNKTRVDGVCTPKPLEMLANRMPGQRFVSTFGSAPNIIQIGRVAHSEMKEYIRSAAFYVATTKETFGIGTLEAMASGLPVVGFKHGATPQLVRHGVDGYLVDQGDYDGLRDAVEYCLEHRAILGRNARARALTYTWERTAAEFAEIYKAVLAPRANPKVSVVIPCFNYGKYVGDAIQSVLAQDIPGQDWLEIIVVDDGSTDNSVEVIQKFGDRVKLIRKANAGVAYARNDGVNAARGEYIICLDADDKLGSPLYATALSKELDNNPDLGIVYTSLRFMSEDGSLGSISAWPDGFEFEKMIARHNQVPTCNMFRKEAFVRAGGYRKRYTPAEDADLWLRMCSIGYGAKHAIREGWFWYRMHEGSLSRSRPEPDWCDKPWIANGKRPMACLGEPSFYSWPVRDYDEPIITVIVPVGPGHAAYLPEALDSIEAQTEMNWECIVVNDSGEPLHLQSYPWVRVITTPGKRGASYARNRGIEAASTALVTFLDADDAYLPDYLELMLRAYSTTERYAYCDWLSLNKAGQIEMHETPDYNPNEVFNRTSIHSINVVMRKEWAVLVGMFDETMRTWEDVDFFMKLAKAGICGTRVPKPLMVYRYTTGQLRENGEVVKSDLIALLRARYGEYIRGEKMCGCSAPNIPPPQLPVSNFGQDAKPGEEMVLIMYTGATGSEEIHGPVTRQYYGRRSNGDVFYILRPDLQAAPNKFKPIARVEPERVRTPKPPAPVLVEA